MSILQGLLPNFLKPEKYQEKYIKNQHNGSFQITEDGPQGGRGCPGDLMARPGPRPHQEAAWVGPPPPVPSFGLYLVFREETLAHFLESRISPSFCRRNASEIESVRRPLPSTLPEGGLTFGSFSVTMDASQTCRE